MKAEGKTLEKVAELQMAIMNFDPEAKSVIKKIDEIENVKVDVVDGAHYILGYPIYCPYVNTTFPYGLPTYDLAFLYAIESEIDLCKTGYKKVTIGSSKDFDGGYKFAKLWMKKDQVFKVTFLTPTQAEFDKDECSVRIRPYPFYEGHAIGTPTTDYFGVYSENDELRQLLFDSKYRGEAFRFNKEIVIGQDSPVMDLLRVQKFGGTWSLYLYGKRVLSSTLLYRAYKEMLNHEGEYPHLFKLRLWDDVIVDMEYVK